AAAFGLLYECLARGGHFRAAALGLWCGLGLYLDRMFVLTVAGLVPAAVVGWWASGRSRRGLACGLAAVAAAVVGYLPHEVGMRVDPHDAAPEQFDPFFVREALIGHARLLGFECLPRLIVGLR